MTKERLLTKKEKMIINKYTKIGERLDDKQLFLEIDQQGFTIDIGGNTNIKWFREQLAIALTKMIENEKEETNE